MKIILDLLHISVLDLASRAFREASVPEGDREEPDSSGPAFGGLSYFCKQSNIVQAILKQRK